MDSPLIDPTGFHARCRQAERWRRQWLDESEGDLVDGCKFPVRTPSGQTFTLSMIASPDAPVIIFATTLLPDVPAEREAELLQLANVCGLCLAWGHCRLGFDRRLDLEIAVPVAAGLGEAAPEPMFMEACARLALTAEDLIPRMERLRDGQTPWFDLGAEMLAAARTADDRN